MNDPNLTDDTFVVEAPSFIVPYVYEKPPKETIKDFKKSVQDILDKKDKEDGEDKKEENGKEEDAVESKDKSEEEVKKAEEEKKKAEEEKKKEANKPKTYFESVLGKFIMDLGMNLVQESVQV